MQEPADLTLGPWTFHGPLILFLLDRVSNRLTKEAACAA